MISEALVPPKPNEFDSTVLIYFFFAVCGEAMHEEIIIFCV